MVQWNYPASCNFQSEMDFQPYTVKLTSHIVFFIFLLNQNFPRQQETGRMGQLTEYNWYNW